ncbi:DUF6233 domain-containing protein [Streptomyces sp. NPDC017993]|uniref:DUF6233 domain-containing protein n=1 Tax=Streptomyces sp. NPDC017993 TaxID=3365027 RepID=UPI00378BDF57
MEWPRDQETNTRPRAEVSLPDGQRLRAAVTRRRRDRAGVWWYDLEVEIPDRDDDRRHGPTLTTRVIAFSAPHPVVQPLPSEDYSSLNPPPAHLRRRWRIYDAPRTSPSDYYIHRDDCAQCLGDRLLSDAEALQALADHETTAPCPVCRPDTVLSHLR